MGDPKGFLKVTRQNGGYRPVNERILDFNEVEQMLPETERKLQASRCMDCGVPFCHWACPVNNVMPEWQDSVYKGDWATAIHNLQSTNNFPEFTGRVCPALCEASCVLGLGDVAVSIRENEWFTVEKAFEDGLIKANPPTQKSGKKVAVIGAGPAGLACADQLNKAGHLVTLFEKDEEVGGLLRFGIPDFKLDKKVIERRVNILREEGLEIKTNMNVGKDISIADLQKQYDAICLTVGAKQPRDLNIEGRNLKGVYFAMDYLTQQNRSLTPKSPLQSTGEGTFISAKGLNVLVIGGGDTGSDCVGTANRQGAKSVTQIEIMPKPTTSRDETMPWPMWPTFLKTSSSHLEGCNRMWSISSKKFSGPGNQVSKLLAEKVKWSTPAPDGRRTMETIPNSEFEIEADLVFLAMGFTQPIHEGLLNDLGVEYDQRGNVKADESFLTSKPGIFVAGDAKRGASLVVWAIAEGRLAAEEINKYL